MTPSQAGGDDCPPPGLLVHNGAVSCISLTQWHGGEMWQLRSGWCDPERLGASGPGWQGHGGSWHEGRWGKGVSVVGVCGHVWTAVPATRRPWRVLTRSRVGRACACQGQDGPGCVVRQRLAGGLLGVKGQQASSVWLVKGRPWKVIDNKRVWRDLGRSAVQGARLAWAWQMLARGSLGHRSGCEGRYGCVETSVAW